MFGAMYLHIVLYITITMLYVCITGEWEGERGSCLGKYVVMGMGMWYTGLEGKNFDFRNLTNLNLRG